MTTIIEIQIHTYKASWTGIVVQHTFITIYGLEAKVMTGYNISQIQEKPTINVDNARCMQCERVRETGGCAAQSLSKLLSYMGDFRKSFLEWG